MHNIVLVKNIYICIYRNIIEEKLKHDKLKAYKELKFL